MQSLLSFSSLTYLVEAEEKTRKETDSAPSEWGIDVIAVVLVVRASVTSATRLNPVVLPALLLLLSLPFFSAGICFEYNVSNSGDSDGENDSWRETKSNERHGMTP